MTAVAIPASAQVWDFTGNNLLNGTYVFREAIYPADSSGSLTGAVVIYGNIVFNGNGGYTINGNGFTSSGSSGTYNTTGTYSISASGFGFMKHPYASSGVLHGLVSNGVFVGSSTENGFNDLMIAVPASSATNATFTGNYTLDYINFPGSTHVSTYDSIAQFTANGSGNIGTVSTKTYQGGNLTTPVSLNENNVSYSFTNGVGTLRFPTTTNLPLQGNKILYISPDGKFIFGGGTATFDFFVGVRKASGEPTRLNGLYYTAGINHILDQGVQSLDTFYGAFTANSTVLLEHQRFLSTFNGVPVSYTAAGVLPSEAKTEYTDDLSAVEYTVGQEGNIRIGVGQSPYLGLRIAVRGPKFTAPSSAPYIDPTGVINAASFAPFTSGVAPGELVSIYGSNLAASTVVTQGGVAFPASLDGVQVLMNNRPAPLYFVSPGQIAAIVPYGTTEPIVQVQVNRNGVTSNAVTALRNATHPGIFSQSQSGEGIGAVLHTDYSLVTEAKPALPGETIQVYLTGLGAVFPTIADGALGGATELTLNKTQPGSVRGRVDNLTAEVAYAGLAPGLAGLYQVNLTVPTNSSAGNVFLNIETPDAITSQVALPVGVAALAADSPAPRKAVERPFVRRR
jgi:uncharacterized protein (TIGR03437 family)